MNNYKEMIFVIVSATLISYIYDKIYVNKLREGFYDQLKDSGKKMKALAKIPKFGAEWVGCYLSLGGLLHYILYPFIVIGDIILTPINKWYIRILKKPFESIWGSKSITANNINKNKDKILWATLWFLALGIFTIPFIPCILVYGARLVGYQFDNSITKEKNPSPGLAVFNRVISFFLMLNGYIFGIPAAGGASMLYFSASVLIGVLQRFFSGKYLTKYIYPFKWQFLFIAFIFALQHINERTSSTVTDMLKPFYILGIWSTYIFGTILFVLIYFKKTINASLKCNKYFKKLGKAISMFE